MASVELLAREVKTSVDLALKMEGLSSDEKKELLVRVAKNKSPLDVLKPYVKSSDVLSSSVAASWIRTNPEWSGWLLTDKVLDKMKDINETNFLLLRATWAKSLPFEVQKKVISRLDFSADKGVFLKSLLFQENEDLLSVIKSCGSYLEVDWSLAEIQGCWSLFSETKKDLMLKEFSVSGTEKWDKFLVSLMEKGEHHRFLSFFERVKNSNNIDESNPLVWIDRLIKNGAPSSVVSKVANSVDWTTQKGDSVCRILDINELVHFPSVLSDFLTNCDVEGYLAFSIFMNTDLDSQVKLIRYLSLKQAKLLANSGEFLERFLSCVHDSKSQEFQTILDWLEPHFKASVLKNAIRAGVSDWLFPGGLKSFLDGGEQDEHPEVFVFGKLMAYLPIEETSKDLFDFFLGNPSAPVWNSVYQSKVLSESFAAMWGVDGEPAEKPKKLRL